MNGLVMVANNQVVVSSRDVAENFGKRHDKLFSEIERMYGALIANEIGLAPNGGHPLFVLNYYVHPQNNQTYKEYLMNRDGFSLLVMSFTGEKAMEWKLRYINAFNEMEARLRGNLPNFSNPAIAARAWADEYEKRQAAEAQIKCDRAKVIFANAVTTSKSSILVGDLAKFIRQNGKPIGCNRLFNWLRENGYLIKSGTSRNMPTQRSMELGLFEVLERTIKNPDGSIRITKTPKVTGKGQQYFINKFLAHNGGGQRWKRTGVSGVL